jgi:aspartate aminotransferase
MRRFSTAALSLEGQKMFQVLSLAKELEKQGKEIIHFEIGDPDFDTPRNIVDACIRSLNAGNTHYTISSGLEEFREVSAQITKRSRGFKPDINQILVTPGGNVQIYYAIACAVDPGEEVIIIDPAFVSYNAIIKFLGVKAVKVPLFEKNEFRLDPDDVEKAISEKTRMIIINSPHNPTGSVMTEDEVRRMYEIAEKHDLYLVSDEVYGRMVYEDSNTFFSSPSKYDECRERTIIIHSFSKTYAMTGWRVGGVTGPADLIKKMGLLLETTTSCVSPFIQEGAIEALMGSQTEIDNMIKQFRKRRDLIVSKLNDLPGVSCIEPKGAFYTFPNITQTGLSSMEFSEMMLKEAGVATCPGHYFGEHGEGYVRFCYANSISNIEKGIAKIKSVLEKR